MGHHYVLFTFGLLFTCFIVFFYMIGAYPLFALQKDPGIATCLASSTTPANRHLFVHWMFPQVPWSSERMRLMLKMAAVGPLKASQEEQLR